MAERVRDGFVPVPREELTLGSDGELDSEAVRHVVAARRVLPPNPLVGLPPAQLCVVPGTRGDDGHDVTCLAFLAGSKE